MTSISESDGFGLMRCATRDAELFFNICECLDVSKRKIQVGDECDAERTDECADVRIDEGADE